jgi:hypothetical protein
MQASIKAFFLTMTTDLGILPEKNEQYGTQTYW